MAVLHRNRTNRSRTMNPPYRGTTIQVPTSPNNNHPPPAIQAPPYADPHAVCVAIVLVEKDTTTVVVVEVETVDESVVVVVDVPLLVVYGGSVLCLLARNSLAPKREGSR